MYRNRKLTKAYKPSASRKVHYASSSNCPFCKKGQVKVIESGKDFRIVKNTYGYSYWEFMDVVDHLMIVPKRHVENMSDFSDKECAEVVRFMAKYEKLGYNVYAREKYNVIKSVPHQHTHLIKTTNKKSSFFIYIRRPYIVAKV